MARSFWISSLLLAALPASLGLAVGSSALRTPPTAPANNVAGAFDAQLPQMDMRSMQGLDMELLDFEERLQHTAATSRNDSWERMLEASLHGFDDDAAASSEDLMQLLGDDYQGMYR